MQWYHWLYSLVAVFEAGNKRLMFGRVTCGLEQGSPNGDGLSVMVTVITGKGEPNP